MKNNVRETVQKEALAAWDKAGRKNIVELITGLGKTKVALDCIKLLGLSFDAKILFLAETKQREKDLNEEIIKHGFSKYTIEFACYQSAYKWKNTNWDFVIADEIHDSLTEEYQKFYRNNSYKALIGLSATVDRKAIVGDPEESKITKGDLVNELFPVCYTYTIDEGQQDGTARKLRIFEIRHVLDMKSLNVTGGTKAKPFLQTEYSAYKYREDSFKKALWLRDGAVKNFQISLASRKRAELLYNLPSKVAATKKLIKGIKGKTILFGNSLSSLESITPNVVSSNNSDKENSKVRADFEKGKSKIIASFKVLQQGANLGHIDNCVIMSYYSKKKQLIQMVGRLRNDESIGNIFIFVTQGTQEEVWYRAMLEDIESFDIIRCLNVQEAIDKYVKLKK